MGQVVVVSTVIIEYYELNVVNQFIYLRSTINNKSLDEESASGSDRPQGPSRASFRVSGRTKFSLKTKMAVNNARHPRNRWTTIAKQEKSLNTFLR